MSEPFIGQIILVPYTFAPRGWAFCNGQILPIIQNTALFSLLGTTYGGDGVTTFGLPDLRGRVALSSGDGPGISSYFVGQVSGAESVVLNVTQLPVHNHPFALGSLAATANVKNAAGNSRSPVGAMPAIEAAGVTATYSDNAVATAGAMAPGAISLSGAATVGATGDNQPFQILQPSLALNYCIALQGLFPSRN
jgi:microcystin-dependent protein